MKIDVKELSKENHLSWDQVKDAVTIMKSVKSDKHEGKISISMHLENVKEKINKKKVPYNVARQILAVHGLRKKLSRKEKKRMRKERQSMHRDSIIKLFINSTLFKIPSCFELKVG